MVYPHIPWTDERTDDLRRLIDSGFTSGQAATKLGISRNSVIGRCRRADPPINLTGTPACPTTPRPPRPRPQKPRHVPGAMVSLVAAPPLAPTPSPPPASGNPIPFLDLTNETCRWPVTDGEPPFLFCGTLDADCGGGIPYCRAHAKIAYNPRGRAA